MVEDFEGALGPAARSCDGLRDAQRGPSLTTDWHTRQSGRWGSARPGCRWQWQGSGGSYCGSTAAQAFGEGCVALPTIRFLTRRSS